jgi:hypothetical protein
MAALNRFISRLGEKGLPFFKLLKKTSKFEWTEEAKEAFESLKAYLNSSPILTPPKKHKDMMLNIAATSMVVSARLSWREEKKKDVCTKYNGQFTKSVRYYQIPKSSTHMCKNYSMPS